MNQRIKHADRPVPHIRHHFPGFRPGFHHAVNDGRITVEANSNPTGFFLRIDNSRRNNQSHWFLISLDHDLSRFAAPLFDQLDQVLLADDRNASKRDELVFLLESGLFGRAPFLHQADDRMVPGFEVQNLQPDDVINPGSQIIRGMNAISFRYDRKHISAGQRCDLLNFLP